MSLTAENAKVIADYILSDYEHERAPTKRVIAAVPSGQESYSPSGKCMTSLDLAWHIASSELFFLDGVCSGKFGPGPKRPENVQSAQDVLVWYDENLPAAIARTRNLPGEQLAQVIDFFGMMQLTGVGVPDPHGQAQRASSRSAFGVSAAHGSKGAGHLRAQRRHAVVLLAGTACPRHQPFITLGLHFVGLAINRACDHFGRLGVARELRDRTGLDLQRAAHAVADVRQMAEIGAGHRVGDRIMKILLPA